MLTLAQMFLSANRFWDRHGRAAALLTSAAMILVIALFDWWTTPYVSLGLLYLFPIALAAGHLPRTALVIVCIVCAVLSEVFSSLDPTGRPIRLILEAWALGGCGLFVAELIRNRRLSLETQQRLRVVIETSPAAIITLDRRGIVVLANRAATELIIPIDAELVGQPIAGFVPDLQNALRADGDARFRASMQCQVHRGTGETFIADVWFSIYMESGEPMLTAIVADATEEQSDALLPDTARLDDAARPILNDRQVAVLRLVFEGLPNSAIARRLEMTPSAVKNTLQQLFLKTNVNKRSQLVRVALEQYRDLL